MVCSCFPSRTNITKNEQKRALAPIFTSVWNKTPLWKTRRLTYTANHFKNFHCFEVANNHAPAFHQGSILLKMSKKGVGTHIYFCMKWKNKLFYIVAFDPIKIKTPQNNPLNLILVKDIHVICKKLTRGGCKIVKCDSIFRFLMHQTCGDIFSSWWSKSGYIPNQIIEFSSLW